MGKDGRNMRKSEHCGGSYPAVSFLSRFGGAGAQSDLGAHRQAPVQQAG